MRIHKLAKYFPVLEGEEFDLLVEDIKKHGQQEPIITVGDEILDGVNRYRACRKLDREPVFEAYTGDDPLAYVISLNIRRRHLSESQRAMLATEMLPEFEKEAKERMRIGGTRTPTGGHVTTRTDGRKELARDDAARVFGVSGPSIQRAKRIKQEAPEKAEEIIKGKTTVGAVDNELRQAEAAKRAAARQEKQTGKEVKQEHHGVAEYFDALKAFRSRLQLTLEGSKREHWFAPESINLMRKKHDEIRALMAALEETV